MGKRDTDKNRTTPAWAGLAMAIALLALSLVLLAGTVAAAGSQGLPSQGPAQPGRGDRPVAPTAAEGDGVWTPLGGPVGEGGQVGALAVHPTISGTVYAAVAPPGAYDSGPSIIYKTTDGAATWTPVFSTERQVYSLGVTGTVVYAGAFNPGGEGPCLYVSHDSGLTWAAVLTATDRGVWLDIAVHPTDPDVAIVGGWFYRQVGPDRPQNGLVYRTDDAGLTWTPILTTTYPDAEDGILAVLIHPISPTILLAAAHHWGGANQDDSYLYRSDDGGATWPVSTTVSGAHVFSLAAHASDPELLYAGTGASYFSRGPRLIYRSEDAGLTWTEVLSDAGGRLAFEPPSTVYFMAEWGELWASSADGDPGTWNALGGIWDSAIAFDLDLAPSPPTLYVGGDRRGVFKGVYDGANWNWEERNNNIENPLPPRDIDLDPSNPGKMFAATECTGGWLSTDGGWNWTRIEEACMGAYAINPENPNIVYGGEYNCGRGPVRRSEDGGFTFRSVFTPTFIISDCSGGDEAIFDLAIAPSMSSTVYAVGADHPNWSGDQAVAVRSLDDGASWTVVFTLPEWSQIGVVTIDPTAADVVYLGGEACDQFGCEGFVYRSMDGGDTWAQTLAVSSTVTSIVVDDQKPHVLYVGDRSYTIRKSLDGGQTWFIVRDPPPLNSSGYLLTIDPNAPSHVTLGGWGYIAETPDGGQTWFDWPLNNGTPHMEPTALVVDTGSPTQTLYAGFTGVWAYSRPAPQPGEAMTIHMYTDPITNPLYANGLNSVSYYAYPLDEYENWTAPGTPVSVTYEWLFGDWNGQLQIVKHTNDDGYVRGGWMGASAEGMVTFTARVNLTATAVVTMAFIYNPPAGISAEARLDNATTAIVSATVPGLHDGVASDGTQVTFESSLGTIDATAWTAGGVATATLTSGSAGGVAIITATVNGFSDVTTVDFGPYRIYLPVAVKNN